MVEEVELSASADAGGSVGEPVATELPLEVIVAFSADEFAEFSVGVFVSTCCKTIICAVRFPSLTVHILISSSTCSSEAATRRSSKDTRSYAS